MGCHALVCVCACVRVSEWVRIWRWDVTLGCRMGLESQSVSLGGMGGAQSQCVSTELPLPLSLSLPLSLITHFLVQTVCVSQASVVYLQAVMGRQKSRH